MSTTMAHLEEPAKEPSSASMSVISKSPEETASIHGIGADVLRQEEARHPREGMPKWQWQIIILGNGIMSLVNGYDVSNVANVQILIYKAFGHIELLPWISLAYSVVNMATIPLARKLTGICELRTLCLVSCLLVMAGSALSGAAPNVQAVIVGRALLALGGAPMYQIALTYNVVFAYPHELGLAQAVLGAFFAVGLITGPIIGGAFADNEHTTWRWAFYIVLPLTALVSLCIFFYPSYRVPSRKSALTNLKEFDWIGCVLHIGTFILLGLSCIFSGPTWAWNSGSTIAVWVLLGVVFAAYVAQQTLCLFTTPERRIFPVSILRKSRVVVLTFVCSTCNAVCYGVNLYYTPIYFAFTRGYGPLAAAVRLLPFVCVFIVMTFFSGGLLPAVKYYMPFYVVGGILILVGAGVEQTITAHSSEAKVLGLEALIGAGVGLLWQLAAPVSTMVLEPHERLDAMALVNMAALGGTAIALSIAGTIYQNVGYILVESALDGFGYSSHDVRELLAGADSPILRGGHPEVLVLVVDAITKTILRCFYITLAASAICFIAACCMKFEALPFKKPEAPKGSESAEKTPSV